jgi:uncharacterized protein YggE
MDSGITVTGAGSAAAPADLLRVTLGVGHEAGDVADAVDSVGVKTGAVIAALRAQGVEEGDIGTTGVQVFPAYAAEPARVEGYRASHSISVATKDLDGFGRLLTAAIDAAGNDLTVDQVGFDVADKTDLVVRAREAAFADALERAEHLARLAGRALGRIESVEESPLHGPVGVPFGRASKASLAPLDFGVEPGRQTVEVALTIQWSWAQTSHQVKRQS